MPRLTAKIERVFKIPGDPDGASLKIKHLKSGELQKIESEYTDWTGKQDKKEETFTTELKFDPMMQLRAVRAASVVDWKGFKGYDDEVLDCTKKNINLYLDEDPILGDEENGKTFSAWIDDFRKILIDEVASKKAEAEKN